MNTKGQISEALIDEAQQLEYEQVVYIMSRLRTDANMKPYMRMTCNPLRNSWLREWVDWYLIPGSGLPDPRKCGVLRYFIIIDSVPHWSDSKEELYEQFGKDVKPLSFTFINANVYDNPVLMKRQPEYVGWLEGLPRVEKARLLHGDWDATELASGFWKADWCEIVDTSSYRVKKRVRAWDIAATLPSEVYPNPDWTVGVLMAETYDGKYIVEDVIRFRDRFAGVEEKIFKTAETDPKGTIVCLPVDPGSSGKIYAADLSHRLASEGHYVRTKRADKSKITRFGPFATVSENGFVQIKRGDWLKAYTEELESFTGDGKLKDDQVDATSDAFWALKQTAHIPNFTLPVFERESQFAVTY